MRSGIYAVYREEREKGMTYQQIADKYGVTRQNVAMACGKANPNRFQWHPKHKVVYPNLRKWLNDNKVSKNEILRRAGMEVCASSSGLLGKIFKGTADPRKSFIDKLIEITGMPYEKLFAKSEEEVIEHEMDSTS